MGFNKKPRFKVSYELFYNSFVVTYEVTDYFDCFMCCFFQSRLEATLNLIRVCLQFFQFYETKVSYTEDILRFF